MSERSRRVFRYDTLRRHGSLNGSPSACSEVFFFAGYRESARGSGAPRRIRRSRPRWRCRTAGRARLTFLFKKNIFGARRRRTAEGRTGSTLQGTAKMRLAPSPFQRRPPARLKPLGVRRRHAPKMWLRIDPRSGRVASARRRRHPRRPVVVVYYHDLLLGPIIIIWPVNVACHIITAHS